MMRLACFALSALALTSCAVTVEEPTENDLASVAALNEAGAPASITAPGDDFTAAANIGVVAQVDSAFVQNPKKYVTLTVDVEGCQTQTVNLASAGTLWGSTVQKGPNAGKPTGVWTWAGNFDLSACTCAGGAIERTHHCDGCGHTFDTCEGVAAACEARWVMLTLRAYNIVVTPKGTKTVPVCTADFDGDGVTECSRVVGLLPAGETTLTEIWAPQKFWVDDDTTCVDRGLGGGCTSDPKPNQGGDSCAALGL